MPPEPTSQPDILFMGRIFFDPWGGVRQMAEETLRAAAPLCEASGRMIEVLVPRPGMCPVTHPAIREVVLPRFGNNRMAWDHITVPNFANGRQGSVLYNPKLVLPERLRIPGFTTIHDLMYFPNPQKYNWREYYWADSIYMQRMVRRTVRRAPRIHVPSAYTREDALELFPDVDPDKFTVIPWAVDPKAWAPHPWSAEDQSEWEGLLARGLREPFVFHAGGLSRRKNVRVLGTAFAEFRKTHPEYQLVLTATSKHTNADPKTYRALHTIPPGSVIALGGVSARALRLLYQRASFFVFPSLYEGFGLPLLEAQAAGCPVICSHATSHPEVVGESAMTFNPRSARELLHCMEQMTDQKTREKYRQLSAANVARFPWNQTARQWLDLADRVHREG
ncbi:MAG: glycosyltransferase family 4 protein [Candidatus Sumerlaeia bacterium]|nr:glycosyltransferase family 4 protein [Candidatus Sumerlaeia bacterium]